MNPIFSIVKHIGVLKEYPTGWTKELNIVEWNGVRKYDIREWDYSHTRMTRGVALSEEEFLVLKDLLREE